MAEEFRIEPATVDQAAAALALLLGSVAEGMVLKAEVPTMVIPVKKE